jgi:nucleotide-binding universal stress UspA family protein
MSQTDEVESPERLEPSLRNLVVGVDGSPTSANALEWAGHAAGRDGSVDAVHAVRMAGDVISSIVTLDPDALANESRRRLDEEWTADARAAGVVLTTHLSFDHTAEALLEVAAQTGADAIVVGAHGTGRWSRHYLGSTASKLLHRCDLPVVVVPGRAEALSPTADRVVVGYDGSPAAEEGLLWGADVAAQRNLPIEVLTVVSPDEYAAVDLFSDLDLDAYRDELATKVAASVARLLPHPPTPVTRNVVLGDPLQVLLDATDTAWLLVVGRALSHRLDEYLTGSTARHCAARGHCAVAVIPATPTGTTG